MGTGRMAQACALYAARSCTARSVFFVGVAAFGAGCGEAPPTSALAWGAAPEASQAHAPIVQGRQDRLAVFDATGALLITTQQGSQALHTHLCTATLLAPHYVVTAAHCQPPQGRLATFAAPITSATQPDVLPQAASGVRGTSRQRPVLRVWYTFCLADRLMPQTGLVPVPSESCVRAEAFLAHPDYRLPGPWDEGLTDAYDIALVRLVRPITAVMPARLPSGAGPVVSPGEPVLIAGFGSIQDSAQAHGPPEALGQKRWAESRVGHLSDAEMTVGEPPCPAHKSFGDSGGPTFVSTPSGPVLIGVTSRLLTASDAALGTVDTRLDAARDWLINTAGLAADGAEAAVDDDEPQR